MADVPPHKNLNWLSLNTLGSVGEVVLFLVMLFHCYKLVFFIIALHLLDLLLAKVHLSFSKLPYSISILIIYVLIQIAPLIPLKISGPFAFLYLLVWISTNISEEEWDEIEAFLITLEGP